MESEKDINEILNNLFMQTGNIGYRILNDALNEPELYVINENEEVIER